MGRRTILLKLWRKGLFLTLIETLCTFRGYNFFGLKPSQTQGGGGYLLIGLNPMGLYVRSAGISILTQRFQTNKQKNLIGVSSVCVRAKKKNGLINILGKGMINGTGTILDYFFLK